TYSDTSSPATSALDICNCLPALPTSLAIGQRASCTIDNVTLCDSTGNTASVNGISDQTNESVTSTDRNHVGILTASISCNKYVCTAPGFDLDNDPSCTDNHVTLSADGSVNYYVQVCNTGDVPLSNVTVTDAALAGKGCTIANPIATDLAPGQCVTVPLC